MARKFRLTGICPKYECPIKLKFIREILPRTITVLRETKPAASYGCDKTKYTVAHRDATRIRALVGLGPGGYRQFHVCEHMGHLIE